MSALPSERAVRKSVPLARGCFDYFPAALAAVAELSAMAGAQHGHAANDVFWERGKSNDHADCLLRHFLDRGLPDNDGVRHSVKVAWRALALLQLELEAAGAPIAPGARS